jgi:hypothetical protein
MDSTYFDPGIMVKVVNGAFAGELGVVFDHKRIIDRRGRSFPATKPGCYWVMLSIHGIPFPAHLFHDEIEPLFTESIADTPTRGLVTCRQADRRMGHDTAGRVDISCA